MQRYAFVAVGALVGSRLRTVLAAGDTRTVERRQHADPPAVTKARQDVSGGAQRGVKERARAFDLDHAGVPGSADHMARCIYS
jgi:hypothetical protein